MKDIIDIRRDVVIKHLLDRIKKAQKSSQYDMSFLTSRDIKIRLNSATKKLLLRRGSGNYFEIKGRDKILNRITFIPDKTELLDTYSMRIKLNFENDNFKYDQKILIGGTFHTDEFNYMRYDLSWDKYRFNQTNNIIIDKSKEAE